MTPPWPNTCCGWSPIRFCAAAWACAGVTVLGPFLPKVKCMPVTLTSTPKCSAVPEGRHPPESLLVFADDWGRHPSSCQHLVKRLRGDYRILWVNSIGTRQVKADSLTVRRAVEKLKN